MAPAADDEGPSRPLTVKEISDRALAFEWTVNIPFKHWLRTTQTLQQEVSEKPRRDNDKIGQRDNNSSKALH